MASLTMTASFLATARPSSTNHRNFAPVKTSAVYSQKAAVASGDSGEPKEKKENNSRRGMILAAAATIWAARSLPEMAAVALAEAEEPKPGTPEARKKYYPVCVTMPTARICHK